MNSTIVQFLVLDQQPDVRSTLLNKASRNNDTLRVFCLCSAAQCKLFLV